MTNDPKVIAQQRRLAALETALKPIIQFLEDDSIIEIMLNPDGVVWLDQVGKGLVKAGITMDFADSERIIRLCAAAMNTAINDLKPSLAAKLPKWGCRVQASISPIVEGPTFAFRKPSKIIFSLDNNVESGIMSQNQADLLRNAVLERKNILVGGGTGSGKTTLTNALLKCVAETTDRVYIVEDNPELQCTAENKIQILVQHEYSFQQAIMDSLRYRPDRIIVGEVRDGSALDLLKAWNTGHPGGLATIHANDTRSMLDRIGQLIEEVVQTAPRYLIAEAIDICVHITRNHRVEAGREISGISAINGIDEKGRWVMEDLLE
jgi:P-type conjugative transfer ATPase TrbB